MLQNGYKHWQRICISCLLFTDDQGLITNDEENITFMIQELIKEYSKFGVKININETEYLVV